MSTTRRLEDDVKLGSFELTNVSIQSEDEGSVPIARILSTVDGYIDGVPSAASFTVEGIEIDPAHLEDQETKETLAELGYGKLLLSMKMKGAYDAANARATLDTMEISGKEIGRLTISAAFGGMTPEVIAELKRPKHDQGEMLALLQKVTIEGIDIRLDNDSVVDRLLERQAKEAGMDRAAFVQQMSASLPQILMLLNNPPFQEKVSAALSAFLNAPGNLDITASPGQPVPIAAIAGMAFTAPGTLPLLLGVDVTANE